MLAHPRSGASASQLHVRLTPRDGALDAPLVWRIGCNPGNFSSALQERDASLLCRLQLLAALSRLPVYHAVLPLSKGTSPVTATMNLLLSDDYLLQDYPESMTSTIRSGHATMLRFNRKGDYLASGRVDGTVVVWDLETMGVARKMRGHNKSITFLSWSKCGRYLLSTCQGWKAILWDLETGHRHREVRFRAPAYMAELHPWDQYVHSSPLDKSLLPGAIDSHTQLVTSLSRLCSKSSRYSWISRSRSMSSAFCHLHQSGQILRTMLLSKRSRQKRMQSR